MKNFSLPASFFEEISAMHDKLAVKMFRAVYLYMYSDGEDTSIDRIVTIEGADFIARFKEWAQKKFDQAALRRQRAAERRRQRREDNNKANSSGSESLHHTPDSRPSESLSVPGGFAAGSHTSPGPISPADDWEYGILDITIDKMRGQVFRQTGDSRIFALRHDKVALIYLLHFGPALDCGDVYQEHLYEYFCIS